MSGSVQFQFLDAFAQVADVSNKYLIKDKGEYTSSSVKEKKLKTDEILKLATQTLEELLKKNTAPLEERVQKLRKLETAVTSYANRITKWIQNRWWFCILRIFGYPQCPKKITNVKKAVERALKTQEAEQKPKVTETEFKCWNKLKETKDLGRYICSFLSIKDRIALENTAKAEKAIVKLSKDDLIRKASEFGLTDIEVEIAQAAGESYLLRMITDAQKPIDEKEELKQKLCNKVELHEYYHSNDVELLRQKLLTYWGADEVEKNEIKTQDALNQFLLSKWGFSDQEINEAAKSKNGLRKLVREAEEAENCIKLCRFIPIRLQTIITNKFKELLPERQQRIENFCFLDQLEGNNANTPIIGGNTLLKVAKEIQTFFRSPEGQAIDTLDVRWPNNVRRYRLTTLPASVNLLKGLKTLSLVGNFECCRVLPMFSLPNLTKLYAAWVSLQDLPLLNLPKLTEISLHYNPAINLPPTCRGNLENLKKLDAERACHPDFLNPPVTTWNESPLPTSLEELRIRESRFKELPKSIGNLKNLKILSLHQANPTSPDDVFKLIPAEFSQLKKLRELSMSCYQLTPDTKGLETIGMLPKLRRLNLVGNHLKKLPPSLADIDVDFCELEYTTTPAAPGP